MSPEVGLELLDSGAVEPSGAPEPSGALISVVDRVELEGVVEQPAIAKLAATTRDAIFTLRAFIGVFGLGVLVSSSRWARRSTDLRDVLK